jgi:integrase/recombinase XerD
VPSPLTFTVSRLWRHGKPRRACSRETSEAGLIAASSGYRDITRRAALFETLYASGMRISEALSLPSDAARPGTRMLMVRGKGDKQRLVPLHERAIEAIAHWQKLAVVYSGGKPTQWLFHSVRNGTKALTRQAALLEIKEAAVAAGLASPERVSPHVLRHAFATHMHSGGTDLRVLQELLGHAGIETTQIYTHLDTSRLHQMVGDLHPLNEEERTDQWS